MDLFSFPFLSTEPAHSIWKLMFFFSCVNFPTFFSKQHFSGILFLLFWACVGVSQSTLFVSELLLCIQSVCTPVCACVHTHLSKSFFSIFYYNSVTQSCLTLCDPRTAAHAWVLPVHHQLPEFTQTQVHWVSDAIQPSHPLSSPSPPAFNLSQHQDLFQWVSSSHQVAKVLRF